MNENVSKKLNIYKRRLEEEKIIITVYTLIFFTTIILFDLFGLFNFYKILKAKYETTKELENLNSALVVKKEKLEFLTKEIVNVDPYLQSMYLSITANPNVEEYLLSLVEASSKAGFRQKNMNVETAQGDEVKVRTSFEGGTTQLSQLVKNIENIGRLTKVDEINFSTKEGIVSVNMRLTFYFAKKDL